MSVYFINETMCIIIVLFALLSVDQSLSSLVEMQNFRSNSKLSEAEPVVLQNTQVTIYMLKS